MTQIPMTVKAVDQKRRGEMYHTKNLRQKSALTGSSRYTIYY